MRERGVLAAEIEVQVPFHDVDLAQVVWHGHYLKYFENARWALMDQLDCGLEAMIGSGFGWPVVDLKVRYLRFSRYGHRLRVRAALVDWENRLTIVYLVTDAATGERVARAQTRQVAVDGATGVLQLTSPPAFVARIEAALVRAGVSLSPLAPSDQLGRT